MKLMFIQGSRNLELQLGCGTCSAQIFTSPGQVLFALFMIQLANSLSDLLDGSAGKHENVLAQKENTLTLDFK